LLHQSPPLILPALRVHWLSADLKSQIDLALVIPTYVFATPVLGGQLAVSMMWLESSFRHADFRRLSTANRTVHKARQGVY
jgi:hypothetical protein